MQKGLLNSFLLITLGLTLILSTGFVSAAWYNPATWFSNDNSITGNVVSDFAGYDFGGMYGLNASGGYNNPATGARSCPTGFSPHRAYANFGTIKDYPLIYCTRAHTADSSDYLDFGGMYGGGSPSSYSNPATGANTCPSGYTVYKVLGSSGKDHGVYLCAKKHVAGQNGKYQFGGMYGNNVSTGYVNPATGAKSCPSGYSVKQELGTSNLDYPLFYCYKEYSPTPTLNQTCFNFTYSSWTLCVDGIKNRTVLSKSPSGCSGGNPVIYQACNITPFNCTSFTYSGWSSCVNGVQTRTVLTKSPTGCSGGNPVLSQNCVNPKEENISCTDSDGGLSYYNVGRVLAAGTSYEDHCSFGRGGEVMYNNSKNWLYESYCFQDKIPSAEFGYGYEYYYCPNGCSNGACISEENTNCTDSDGGINYTAKGKAIDFMGNVYDDWCSVKDGNGGMVNSCSGNNCTLIEHYCISNGGVSAEIKSVGNGSCSNGKYSSTNVPRITNNGVCEDLINRVANPDGFELYGNDYRPLGNFTTKGYWWVDKQDYVYTEYQASWNVENNDLSQYVSYNLLVFNDSKVNLTSWADEMVRDSNCRFEGWGDSMMLICNYNQNNPNLDENSKYISAIWYNKNVMVKVFVSNYVSLTKDKQLLIAQQKMNDFVQDLRSNEFDSGDWEDFNVEYPTSSLIGQDLRTCGSQMPNNLVRNGTNQTCTPNWQCKIEPVICPPHGEQKKVCVDYGCGLEKQESYQMCSPGMCSGCYAPKWFGGNDERCIPYGFRFEQESGREFQLVEATDQDTLTEGRNGQINLTILSTTTAEITFFGENGLNFTYDLVEGQKTDVTEGLIVLNNQKNLISLVLFVEDIIPASESATGEGSVKLTINIVGQQDMSITLNAYCDIDGQIKMQKTKDKNNDWAKCQNNYECESNLCSSGECIDVAGTIQQAKGMKGLFIKALCRLGNMFDESGYEQCIGQYSI